MTYQNVMVPYDGSDHARKALHQASAILALQGKGTLTLAAVCNIVPSYYSADGLNHYFETHAEETEAEEKGMLDEARSMVPDGIEVKTVFRVGETAPALLEVAKEAEADLIIVGTHGRHAFKSMLLGSVSRYLVLHADCPVMVVR